jgi:hypothetical protein
MSEYGKIHTDGSRSGGQPLADSIEAKELALLNEMRREYPNASDYTVSRIALCRAIEAHEAFKQEVSDALVDYFGEHLVAEDAGDTLASFVIPKPKPDPLVDVAKSLGYFNTTAQHWAGDVRAALDALGWEIREKGE